MHKMSAIKADFLYKFGEIKFGEENSMAINDFGRTLWKHFSGKHKSMIGKYTLGNFKNFSNTSQAKDFEHSFKGYFF